MRPLVTAIQYFDVFVLVYAVLVGSVYLLTLVIASFSVRRHTYHEGGLDDDVVLTSPLAPSIAVIVPAYNEEAGIIDSVRSLLTLRYPNFEIVVVNDGSTDRTLEMLRAEFDLRPIRAVYRYDVPCKPVRGVFVSRIIPNLVVVDKENGKSKSDASNAGINASHSELFCCVDADSLLEPEALLHIVKPFIQDPEHVVAAGGVVRIANGLRIEHGSITAVNLPGRPLAVFQVIEYLRAFLTGRTSWSALNSLIIISGAFGIFRRDLVVKVGGYASGSFAEDAELVMRMHRWLGDHRQKYRIVFVPDPVCWTEAPETLRGLRSQRRRWHRGLAETLWEHRVMIFNPRYGTAGMLGMPYFLIVELIAPVVEATGYIVMPLGLVCGVVNVPMALALVVVAIVYGLVLTTGAMAIEEYAYARYPGWRDLLRLIVYALCENIGYRQLTVFWRIEGLLDLRKRNKVWVPIQRRGLGARPAA